METSSKTKTLTLCIPIRVGEVLLGMKKRGFGAGRWNGFGGKVEEGELIEDAARRECLEEAGIEIVDLKHAGRLRFFYEAEDKVHDVHVYIAREWKGEPVETEEMRPQWFGHDKIPFAEMWADDKYWVPVLLSGEHFEGEFWFDAKGELGRHELRLTKRA